MPTRRFACLLLGMWLGGGFLIVWVTAANFRSADRMVTASDPGALVRLTPLGHSDALALLRHEVSEENRDLFETWEYAQLFLGIFFFAFLLLGTREGKLALGLALLMLVLVAVQRFALTPQLIVLGRPLDFAPQGGPAGSRARFSIVHSTYIGLELVKWAAGIVLGAMLVMHRPRRSGSGHSRQQVNVVDKTDHRHVDG